MRSRLGRNLAEGRNLAVGTPTEIQTQERVRLESEAVLLVLGRCQRGEWQLVGSEAIALEVNQTRDSTRKVQLRTLAALATLQITVNESLEFRAGLFVQQGLRTFDALHLACAEASRATALLTTDDRLVRWAARQSDMLQVKVANPAIWLLEVMSMQTPELSPAQLRREGIEALVQALGAVGMVRFLQQFDQGSGDYTHDRDTTLSDINLEEAIAQINQARE